MQSRNQLGISLLPDHEFDYGCRPLSVYETRATTVVALACDPRFSYCLYVPENGELSTRSLLAVIHGSYRAFTIHRDQFQDFSEANNCIILAPLFPGNILGDGNLDGFKYMKEGDIRYDQVLESIVTEVATRYGINGDRFGLTGFSGGAHFAHRFFILKPQRLWGVSIGAPGSVTLLNPARAWWVGIADTREQFGIEINGAQLAKVPVQMIVGDADLETLEINHRADGRNWAIGANDAGITRPERLLALRKSFTSAGISVQFDMLAGVGHDPEPIFETAKPFLRRSLEIHRQELVDSARP